MYRRLLFPSLKHFITDQITRNCRYRVVFIRQIHAVRQLPDFKYASTVIFEMKTLHLITDRARNKLRLRTAIKNLIESVRSSCEPNEKNEERRETERRTGAAERKGKVTKQKKKREKKIIHQFASNENVRFDVVTAPP